MNYLTCCRHPENAKTRRFPRCSRPAVKVPHREDPRRSGRFINVVCYAGQEQPESRRWRCFVVISLSWIIAMVLCVLRCAGGLFHHWWETWHHIHQLKRASPSWWLSPQSRYCFHHGGHDNDRSRNAQNDSPHYRSQPGSRQTEGHAVGQRHRVNAWRRIQLLINIATFFFFLSLRQVLNLGLCGWGYN